MDRQTEQSARRQAGFDARWSSLVIEQLRCFAPYDSRDVAELDAALRAAPRYGDIRAQYERGASDRVIKQLLRRELLAITEPTT